MTYQIMTKTNDRGYWVPDYDELIKHSSCKEEAEKWEKAKEMNADFAFNFVICTKQKCGHWEIFQNPCNEYYPLVKLIASFEEEAKTRECTRCTLDRFNKPMYLNEGNY